MQSRDAAVRAALAKLEPVAFHWRWHHQGVDRRVWLTTWAGDQFEVMNRNDFDELERVAKRFGIRVIEAD